ncbi:MAG: cytochrome c biogenesis protein CcsA [Helicobacteraceae bacterium]
MRKAINKAYRVFSSLKFGGVILIALALGAAAATFVEAFYGAGVARNYFYGALWYECLLALAALNLVLVFARAKKGAVFLFHLSFVLILTGAGITRYFGLDGTLILAQGQTSRIVSAGSSEQFLLPFDVKLENFKVIYYEASDFASDYSSLVRITDADKSSSHEILINKPLNYRGYKFFQSSFTEGEVTLGVAKDPGIYATYLGYATLFLFLALALANKNSRLRKLLRQINKQAAALVLIGVLPASHHPLFALDPSSKDFAALAKSFGALSVQMPSGNIQTLNSLNAEILRKLNGQKSVQGLGADAIILGVLLKAPGVKDLALIKVASVRVREMLGGGSKRALGERKLFSFAELASNKELLQAMQGAQKTPPQKRSTYENELLKINERLNIFYLIGTGYFFKIFKLGAGESAKWGNFKDFWQEEQGADLRRRVKDLLDLSFTQDYARAAVALEQIAHYQELQGGALGRFQTALELFYNKIDAFSRLTWLYLALGAFFLVYGLSGVFWQQTNGLTYAFGSGLFLAFLAVHFAAIVARGAISGFAPLSNTYESIVYIAFWTAAGGLIFRKSALAMAGASLMAGVFMFVAHLNAIDPTITNLVPVLRSLWLSLHVGVITASYGFFGISFFLGFINLCLFAAGAHRTRTRARQMLHLNRINEAAVILGLSLLVVGNFLGAVWANESWGRYWGWDPKETWSYISIIIYAIILHLRLAGLGSLYVFSLASFLAFASILMTYFGVNFYLAGLHSYAKAGDFNIPGAIYYAAIFVTIVWILSYLGFKKSSKPL